MMVRATVLCENSVQGNMGALAEHGWSVWIESEGGPFLFDTGLGTTFLHNAHRFGVRVADAQAILLSHHHSDHTGGLLTALNAIRHNTDRETVPVHAHPDLFKDSFGKTSGKLTAVGLPYTRSVLEVAGADFHLETGWREIAPGLCMTGEIPRVTDFEVVLETMWHRDDRGEIIIDPIRDDQTVVIDTPEGFFVILGCSHAGLINILTYITEQTGKSNFHTIIGGTHLGPVGEDQLDKTIAALHNLDIGRIGVSHCTGPKVAARMAGEFGDRFFFCNVGTVVEV